MAKNGCSYGQVTREKVDNIEKSIIEIKETLNRIDNKILENCNHLSNRLPIWASFLITALFSLTVGLIVTLLK